MLLKQNTLPAMFNIINLENLV